MEGPRLEWNRGEEMFRTNIYLLDHFVSKIVRLQGL
jgi:hypothetical protein